MICRRKRNVIVALAAVVLGTSAHAGAGDEPGEQGLRLRAAFIHNFLKFAQWPADMAEKEHGELVLAVIGEGPIASTMKDFLDGKDVRGQRLRVRSFANVSSWYFSRSEPCHALFVAPVAKSEWGRLREELAGRPVLTIAEFPGFCTTGGMLNLFEHADRIRFEANPDAAGQAGLKLRAELLKLATILKSEGKAP
jgi:hypothetical protein